MPIADLLSAKGANRRSSIAFGMESFTPVTASLESLHGWIGWTINGAMNNNFILFNLREAQEEIDRTIKDLETDAQYTEAEFSVAMFHLYHHVNTAWNSRNSTEEQSNVCSEESFNKWSRYPEDLREMRLD